MKKTRPNIVLIILDTARDANFSCYGYRKNTSPNIDKIAKEGILFKNAISPSPWTLPSHVSFFTGQYPSEHGVTEDKILVGRNIYALRTKHALDWFLPEILKEEGYQTVGFSNNPWISSDFGFSRGFDSFFEIWKSPQGRSLLTGLKRTVRKFAPQKFQPVINNLKARMSWLSHSDSGAGKTVAAMKNWLSVNFEKHKPFFAFFNFMEPHLPYLPPSPFDRMFIDKESGKKRIRRINQDHLKYIAERVDMAASDFEIMRSLYDGEIAYLDTKLKEIFDHLEELSIFEETLLIIASDHGENIGEHKLMGHQFCLYDTLLRVPLIMRYPAMLSKGRIENKYVQSSDVFFTILDILDMKLKEEDTLTHKRSLLNPDYSETIIAEHEVPRITLSALENRYPDFETEGLRQEMKCLYSKGIKYIWNSKKEDELYDLIYDPKEKENLVQKKPQEASELSQLLKQWANSQSHISDEGPDIEFSQEAVDEEIKRKLKDLGYI